MKLFKHLLLSSFVLVPAICNADVSLNIDLTVDETNFEIENVVVSTEKTVLYDNGYCKVEGQLIDQTDEASDVELTVMEEDRVLTKPTMNLRWDNPEILEIIYESEECSCLDRDVRLVVTAQPVE